MGVPSEFDGVRDAMAFVLKISIGHIRILGIGLELAWNGGSH